MVILFLSLVLFWVGGIFNNEYVLCFFWVRCCFEGLVVVLVFNDRGDGSVDSGWGVIDLGFSFGVWL